MGGGKGPQVCAAGRLTFSLPPAQVPMGPKMLWNRAILIGVPLFRSYIWNTRSANSFSQPYLKM